MDNQETSTEKTRVCKCCGKELPITDFRLSKLGRYSTCNECIRQNQIKAKLDKKISKIKGDEIEKARTARLSDFHPRELMKELKRRGYKFTMEYTETHIINSKDIEL